MRGENRPTLSQIICFQYSVLLVLTFVAKIAVGIVALLQYTHIEETLPEMMTSFFAEEYSTSDNASPSFDKMQSEVRFLTFLATL